MSVHGVRGAITCDSDTPDAILSATHELLQAILVANPLMRPEELASVIFTVTGDLASAYPAKAARDLGWHQVPLLCALEIPVPGGVSRCIRILLHWNTDLPQSEIRHIYMGAAAKLRPDLIPKD